MSSFLKTKVLDKAAGLIQNHDAVNQLDLHLISLPCYTHCPTNRQRVTHHFCHHIEPGIWQCVMYDGDKKDSRLIGVEWVISEEKFREVPEEERILWHTHHQEVRGGNMVAPGLPPPAEKSAMQDLANTYGYAVHFVEEGHTLPHGPPKLIMTLCTPEVQYKNMDMEAWRMKDEQAKVLSQEKAIEREKFDYHDRIAGADQWERGGKMYEFVAVPVDKSEEIVLKYGGIRNVRKT